MVTDSGDGARSVPAMWFFKTDDENDNGLRLPLERKPYNVMMYDKSMQPSDTSEDPGLYQKCLLFLTIQILNV